ncbi:hypothetical protein PIB30_079198, partial [Stylosanthes scabra]|nr:hypothetical protein [Stylosanthes scabra]
VIRVRQRGADGDHMPARDEAEPPGVANDSLDCIVRTSIGSVERFTWLGHMTSRRTELARASKVTHLGKELHNLAVHDPLMHLERHHTWLSLLIQEGRYSNRLSAVIAWKRYAR